jgi:hypothetical protein
MPFGVSGGHRNTDLTAAAPMESDDLSIMDDWRLLKRIPDDWVLWDKNKNGWTISSMAFQGHKTNRRAFSVQLEPVLFQCGLTHDSAILDRSKFGLAALTAAEARSCNQVIQREPHPPDDPAHANVLGDKKDSIKKRLRDFAVWVIEAPKMAAPGPA